MFSYKTPISQIIDKWDFPELKELLHSKKTIGRMNRQSEECEKPLQAIFLAGLMSRKYKELRKSNTTKMYHSISGLWD